MKTFEFTEEQTEMIANCIIGQIKMWQDIAEKSYPNKKITELVREESVKLQTLLNYINS